MKFLVVLALATWSMPVLAGQVSGAAKAIDSTVIEVNGQRVLLFGIDSVMRKQACTLDGKPWPCWPAAVKDLQALLDQGPVVCETVGEPDVYGRTLARCKAGEHDVNEELVAHGFALARTNETTEYVAAEAAAKDKKLGLWQGKFMPPGEFRRSVGISVERP